MSLLAALKNKTQPLATAIPAIRATRKAETGGGIAGIAGIAIAAGQNEKVESASEQAANNETHPAPGLAEVINHMAGELGEGWSVDPDMPNRVVHVHQGRLLDSCLFRTNEGALELIRRVGAGEPLSLAFSAACAAEDVQCKTPTPKPERANP